METTISHLGEDSSVPGKLPASRLNDACGLALSAVSLGSISKVMLCLRAAARSECRNSRELVVSSPIYYLVDFWQLTISPFLQLQNSEER